MALGLSLVLHTHSELPEECQRRIIAAACFLTWARSASLACKQMKALMPQEVVLEPDDFEILYDDDNLKVMLAGKVHCGAYVGCSGECPACPSCPCLAWQLWL